MIKWSDILLVVLTAICLSSCQDKDEPVPVAERTVLVYMVAANSLGTQITSGGETYPRADDDDVAEMTRAASSLGKSSRLLVFRDRYEGVPALYELKSNGLVLLKEYDREQSSLTIGRMRSVIADVKAIAPSDKFGIVLWSHANGWLQDGTIDEGTPASTKHHSFGVDRNRRMNVTDLAEALSGFDMEFIYFDCCLMGSIEVAYELRGCARYIVASTSELPRPGMPYDECLPLFMQKAPEGLIASAAATYRYYRDHENPGFRTCTISVIDTYALPQLAAATRAVYTGAPLAHQGDDVTNYNAVGRSGYWIDFGEYAASLASAPDRDKAVGDEFEAALSAAVIYEAATAKVWDRYPVYRHSGLSTYVFNNRDGFTINGYDQLAWARDVVSHHLN